MSFQNAPYLCDFHHIDKTKEKLVSILSKNNQQLKKEIKKCIPLCANCHRHRHHGEVV